MLGCCTAYCPLSCSALPDRHVESVVYVSVTVLQYECELSYALPLGFSQGCQIQVGVPQEHVNGPVRLVCFNLGYLPGGDRQVCTSLMSACELPPLPSDRPFHSWGQDGGRLLHHEVTRQACLHSQGGCTGSQLVVTA